VQQKIVYAGVAASSFAKGSELLDKLAELPASTKQVERLSRAIGSARVAQRDQAATAFEALPLAEKFQAPAGVYSPELAVVEVDGGRLQIREREGRPAADGQEAPTQAEGGFDEDPQDKGFWREDKLGTLLVMQSEVSADDPCPHIPPGFIDASRIPKLAREIGKVGAGQGDPVDAAELTVSPGDEAGQREANYEPPVVQRRNVVGTCRPWWSFALLLASAAHAAGLQKAQRKAFVGDGSANDWRLHKRYFGSFVPVLDFIHALSYVYAAATAGRPLEQGWETYRRWISWVWQGEVSRVIEQIAQRQQEVGPPQEGASQTSVAAVVARSLAYLNNHRDKMKYHEYRKAGLPLTSSLMESTVKQVNRRVKGTEKFWCGEGAEAILQLRVDYLSDDQPLDDFFEKRQREATGQRPYRRAA